MESLALKYRWTIERLEALSAPRSVRSMWLAAARATPLLCQFTADACGRPVYAGPIEATAAGNVLLQAMARGKLGSLAEARAVVARSFPVLPTSLEIVRLGRGGRRFNPLVGT